MKRIIILAVLFLLPLTMSAENKASAQDLKKDTIVTQGQPIDRIVAIVNDSVITDNELNVHVNQIRLQIEKRQMQLPPENILRKQVLQHMIDTELQLQMAKQAGIEVDNHDVDEAIQKVAERNHVTLEQLQKTVQSEGGMSWKSYRNSIKKELMISRLEQKAAGQIIVTDQQVDDYLNSNSLRSADSFHVQDILIPLPSTPTSEQVQKGEAQAEHIIKQLKAGANFNQLALAESSGQDALQGGDLGFRKLAELPEAFAARVVAMKPGDIAGPIRTPNGLHVIKLVEVQGGSTGNKVNPNQKEQVRNLLYQRKFNEAIENWMQRLRSAAYIKIFL